uniref:Uncharacterized protein n=1 Tax=Chromera velia CCMP2878 TaxID=1169474 RepID=A0A0G4FYL9_9ALVE|eukprot:Cvel_3907.t1-p1 / transcript=Cvel_3907.t1 / gene=Cvel_3907 / organism=Chromera_velia_CCMP2878 / gene_product=hypothetical protein / transcript_product=hypothetical protein / location=Cvel_scaffold165:79205-79903(-) / protein_length=233 / sequence_SO=supercontig / SO=protein_coding / is_pseudo=false
MESSDHLRSEARRLLCVSGALGVKRFWKFTSLSKQLLALRDDPSLLGLGSIVSAGCLESVSEREALQFFLFDCIERKNVKALKQLCAVKGVPQMYYYLKNRALRTGSYECYRLSVITSSISRAERPVGDPSIGGIGVGDFRSFVSEASRDAIASMLQSGDLHPDMRFESDTGFAAGYAVFWTPLLIVLIDLHRFDYAEAVLDAGARVDLCQMIIRRGTGDIWSLGSYQVGKFR